MSRTVIRTEGLIKCYGEVDALAGLDLLCKGGVNGLIGPNGSGKTTTLLILLGLVSPTAGDAFVLDLDCRHDSFKIRQRVGILHETPRFPSQITGRRLLRHVFRLHQIKGDEHKIIRDTLKEVELEQAADRKIGTYSAGMIQRLGLAQALVCNPELIILDEPTANLDPKGRHDILNLIRHLRNVHGTYFLISTHLLLELERVCDWVSIIDQGIIVTQGPMSELVARYSSPIFLIESSAPQRLAEALRSARPEIVDKVRIQEDVIICHVTSEEPFQRGLTKVAADLGVGLRRLERVKSSLEHIFLSVLEGEQVNNGEP